MVYAYGLRNPFRFSLDPRSGMPIVGDVGWSTYEEINTLAPETNAGWPCFEGCVPTTFSSASVCKALQQRALGAHADLDLPARRVGRGCGGRYALHRKLVPRAVPRLLLLRRLQPPAIVDAQRPTPPEA